MKNKKIRRMLAPLGIFLITLCAKITQNMALDCDDPMVAGAHDEALLINFQDWKDAVITRNATNSQIIEGIALPSGTVGYIWQGQNGSFMPKCTMVKQKYSKKWNHAIGGVVFTNSPDVKKEFANASGGRVVVIIHKNYEGTDGNAAYEVYGDKIGLELAECEKDDNNAETQGAWTFLLQSPDDQKEPKPQATLFLTDLETTTAIYDSLYA